MITIIKTIKENSNDRYYMCFNNKFGCVDSANTLTELIIDFVDWVISDEEDIYDNVTDLDIIEYHKMVNIEITILYEFKNIDEFKEYFIEYFY